MHRWSQSQPTLFARASDLGKMLTMRQFFTSRALRTAILLATAQQAALASAGEPGTPVQIPYNDSGLSVTPLLDWAYAEPESLPTLAELASFATFATPATRDDQQVGSADPNSDRYADLGPAYLAISERLQDRSAMFPSKETIPLGARAGLNRSIEAGMTGEAWTRTYRVAIYDVSWQDLESGVLGEGLLTRQVNRTLGAALNAQALDNLTVSFGFSQMRYDQSESKSGSLAFDSAGRLPDQQISVGASYLTPVYGYDVRWNISGSYRDQFLDSDESSLDDYTVVPTHPLWNASVSVERPNWDATLYIINVTNEETTGDTISHSAASREVGDLGSLGLVSQPRSIGVTVTYRPER